MPQLPDTSAISKSFDRYWLESARPLTSLAFVAPLLVAYEAGVRLLGAEAARNGADVWMRKTLESLDLQHYFLLPALTVAILLAWHHTTNQSWRVSRAVLGGMVLECVLMAACLRAVLRLQAGLWQVLGIAATARADTPPLELGGAGRLIGFLGAGVYEELLFRLILLTLALLMATRIAPRGLPSTVASVLVTSLVFAAAHYVGRYGEPVALADGAFWFGFLFRTIAGVFFSALFLCRGFGIAAGAHAGYDILVGMF